MARRAAARPRGRAEGRLRRRPHAAGRHAAGDAAVAVGLSDQVAARAPHRRRRSEEEGALRDDAAAEAGVDPRGAEAEAAAEAAAEARRAREHHAKIEARSREGRRASIRVPANAVMLLQARARGNAVRATMMALAGVAIVMQTAARRFLAAKRERERRARDAAPPPSKAPPRRSPTRWSAESRRRRWRRRWIWSC